MENKELVCKTTICLIIQTQDEVNGRWLIQLDDKMAGEWKNQVAGEETEASVVSPGLFFRSYTQQCVNMFVCLTVHQGIVGDEGYSTLVDKNNIPNQITPATFISMRWKIVLQKDH